MDRASIFPNGRLLTFHPQPRVTDLAPAERTAGCIQPDPAGELESETLANTEWFASEQGPLSPH